MDDERIDIRCQALPAHVSAEPLQGLAPTCHSLPMTGPSIRIATGILGTIAAVVGEAFAVGTGRPPNEALLHLAIGLTYLHGGLAIWGHEPANRTGRLMVLVGLTWFIGTLNGSEIGIVREVVLAIEDTWTVLLVALVLSYPGGRFDNRLDAVAVAILAIGATALNILFSTSLPLLADKSNGLYGGLALALLASAVVIRRYVIAPRRLRRDLIPVLVAGAVFLGTLIINNVRRIADLPDDVGVILVAARDLAPAAIPVALLIGFYRQNERRLRALVDAIPDRMLRFARDGSYLNERSEGRPGSPGDAGVPGGRRLHELMFNEAGDTARLSATVALETGVIQAFDFSLELPDGERQFEARVAPSGPDEVTAIIRDFTAQRAAETELRRSRARIVEATDAERQRLERDLHDGAQQRLVSLSLALRLLRARLGGPDGTNAEAIAASDQAAAELKAAITELRELARGIHPTILTEAGLGAALTSLVDRSVIPASVSSLPDRRLSQAIEATAYFVVSEALTNTAKYASATRASVGAACVGSTLRVEVADDGVGGADDSRGTGIRGLQDRVAALGGRLTIESPAGQGTLVVAEIPIG
jgi:signal transduction histidine kinase